MGSAIIPILLRCRIGRTATLTVRTEDELDKKVSGTSEGKHAVLDIHPRISKFYVGGVRPGAGVSLAASWKSRFSRIWIRISRLKFIFYFF